MPGRPDLFPLGPLRHGRDNHGNLAICRAVPVPVQSLVRDRLGCCRVTLGQPTVQCPAADAARSAARAAQASSWVSSSQSLDCCSPAAHLSSQTLLDRPVSLGNRRSKWRAGPWPTISWPAGAGGAPEQSALDVNRITMCSCLINICSLSLVVSETSLQG